MLAPQHQTTGAASNIYVSAHNNDDIDSDSSDLDNPYQETALEWNRRNARRMAARRCGLSSDESDDSLEEMEEDDELSCGVFDRWMREYPLVAARCCLSIEDALTRNGDVFHNWNGTRRRTAREREKKQLRRVLRKMSKKRNETRPNGAATSREHEMKHHQLVIDSILPKGLGISFIDSVLSTPLATKSRNEKKQHHTFCRTVLEICGPARSGMTSTLIALAARYVANTSNLLFECNVNPATNLRTFTSPNTVIEDPSLDTNARQLIATEPQVVILDLDHGIHTSKLILTLREAVLCRWEEASLARKWQREQQRLEGRTHNDAAEATNQFEEQRQIESAIASCLGRIHIVQPRDFTYLTLVATVESLKRRLETEKIQTKSQGSSSTIQEPPTLLIIDSLSTLDASTRAQESLPTLSGNSGESGLSERNEFYRQLGRLREEHEVAIVGSSRKVLSDNEGGNLWDKMVIQRVGLHHVAEGTVEDRKGFDFVATVKSDKGDPRVFPYTVTSSGVRSS